VLGSGSVSGLNVRDVAIYNDTDSGEWPEGGAWPPLVAALEVLVPNLGYSWEFIDADDVNNHDLGDYYDLIIFPGGWAGGYNRYINSDGYQNLRDFIAEGGAYLGLCAGSFFLADTVFWRENGSLAAPQNVYDYPLDIWSGIADGVILDFQPWDSAAQTGCFNYPGARMVNLRVDSSLLPEANPTVEVLYYGGPVFRPRDGKWTNEKVLARYDMPGFSAHNEPAILLFPYGRGRVLMCAVHPELSLNESTCQLFYDATSRSFLGQLIARLLAPETLDTPRIERTEVLRFPTALGRRYQIEVSEDSGASWQPYGSSFHAQAFEHQLSIPANLAHAEFRATLVE
jgi:glutamine amidotransferase-like uncharacterized protein